VVAMFHTLPELLTHQATRFGDKPFVHFPEAPERGLTYAQLTAGAMAFAQALLQAGVKPGQAVALWLPNIPEFCLAYWGCMCAGVIACPINTLLAGPEVAYIIDNSACQLLVTTHAFAPELARIRDQLTAPAMPVWVVADATSPITTTIIPNTQDFSSVLQKHYPELLTQPILTSAVTSATPAMIIYTSGTTGKPKGVVLTHGNLLANATSINQWFKLTPDTVWMNVLPLFHVNGEVVTLMTPLVGGSSVVLNRKFSVSRFWSTITTYGVTMVSVVPTLLSMLLSQQADAATPFTPQTFTPPVSLQWIICGAAPLPVEVHKQFEQVFGVPVCEGYGLSETTCYATFNPADLSKRIIGSIGVAVDCRVEIMDEHGDLLPPNTPGEIVIQGANVMPGYFNQPEANQKAFINGFFRSGDWGRKDANGFVYIMDRVKDMIIRGGENIYPREVDEVLYQHPGIAAAATIGVPHPTYGEAVKSYVVLQPHVCLTAADVIAYCQSQLALYKCPESVAFVEDIPKGPTGKLLRRALRDLENPA
jgi:acyl-CoA synthetase (AMP-forming)/AMP-acid ligase II